MPCFSYILHSFSQTLEITLASPKFAEHLHLDTWVPRCLMMCRRDNEALLGLSYTHVTTWKGYLTSYPKGHSRNFFGASCHIHKFTVKWDQTQYTGFSVYGVLSIQPAHYTLPNFAPALLWTYGITTTCSFLLGGRSFYISFHSSSCSLWIQWSSGSKLWSNPAHTASTASSSCRTSNGGKT